MNKTICDFKILTTLLKYGVRKLHLLEYQSKELLSKYGVSVQKFCIADDQNNKEIYHFDASEYVVKAQILAGGRGKGQFSNGFKSGVHITAHKEDVLNIINNMLGHKLITPQTPPDGIKVNKIMIAESVNIVRETYLCILLDAIYDGPVIIASPKGGVNIEEIANSNPNCIKHTPINIYDGIKDDEVYEIADFLSFKATLRDQCANEIKKIWYTFQKVDALQIEINPFAETLDGRIISVDAKITFDDNAKFRQQEIFNMDQDTINKREMEAAKYNLNYIAMDGNIGCLVNGAGLAMATMDAIILYGGKPANFLDFGGSIQKDQVKEAFRLVATDNYVRSILVNVFGGIVNCAVVAKGIVEASERIKLGIPVVVRLDGTNVQEGLEIIRKSGLPIVPATNLGDAAKKAILSVNDIL